MHPYLPIRRGGEKNQPNAMAAAVRESLISPLTAGRGDAIRRRRKVVATPSAFITRPSLDQLALRVAIAET